MIHGDGIAARSGGLPPSTAVERSWVRFVDGRYLTFTFGFAFLNPSRTALIDSPSGPVQSARSVTLPLTVELPPPPPPPPPPQPAARMSTSAARSAHTVR